MHVLQICHAYYPPFLDCARQYAALFQGTTIQVTTVYLQGEYDAQVEAGSASHRVIFLGYRSEQLSGLKLRMIADIKRIAANTPFLFCIAHRVKPTYVALLATQLPVISVHHNYNDYQRLTRRLFVNFFRERLWMLGVSDSVRDDLRRDLKGWPTEKIQTLYNRIDVVATQAQLLEASAARDALHLPNGPFIIGNVGRLHHDKDQATLIRAFAMAKPALPPGSLLVIMGAGPLEHELHALVDRLKITSQVILTGNVANAKQFFKAFDVFVLSSDHEPFGMVLLEAMAAQVPIIGSDCGGGREIVEKVGLLFPLGDAAQLAAQLCAIHQHTPNQGHSLHVLNTQFSDHAVSASFWQMPLMQSLVPVEVVHLAQDKTHSASI